MEIAVALVFAWLGLVLGISFIEAPLKFRAPGITRELGLGIGRLVFKALNASEIVVAAVGLIALARDETPSRIWACYLALVAIVAVQTFMIHTVMDRRAARIVEGEMLPASNQHYVYIGLELVKVVLLVVTGVMLIREIAG